MLFPYSLSKCVPLIEILKLWEDMQSCLNPKPSVIEKGFILYH